MEPTERIEVRNIYVSNAAISGVLYGLCLAVIASLFVLIAGLITPDGFSLFGVVYGASVGSLLFLTFLSFVAVLIIVFLKFVVGALIYNFVARIGGRVTLGLAQYVPPAPKPKKDNKVPDKKQSSAKSLNDVRAADYMNSYGKK